MQHPKKMLIEKIIQRSEHYNLMRSRYKPKKRIHQNITLLAYMTLQDLQAIFGDFVMC